MLAWLERTEHFGQSEVDKMKTQNYPFVSVVVPAYNEHSRIADCIEALLAQDYPKDRLEVIVVDNNSTDGMDEVIKRYPVTLLHERNMQTPAATRNTGIHQARGEIVALTDGDCKPRSDWVRRIVAPFTDPDVVGVAGCVQPVGKQTALEVFQTITSVVGQSCLKGLWYVVTGNCAYRRDVLMRVGLFQANLFTAEDIDLGLRLQLQGYGRIVGVDDAVVEHPCQSDVRGLCNQSRRYGYSEVLLDTMYRHELRYYKRPRDQVRLMLRQCRSLFTYIASFIYRSCRSVLLLFLKRRAWNSDYIAWPLLWFASEGSNVQGKLRGIWVTRFFTRLPRRPEQPV